MSLGIGLLFAAFWGVPFIAGIFSESYIGQLMFAFIGSAILLIIFSFVMPRKTKKGVKVVEHILGFKEFIKTAEKDRIKFFQELKDKADEEGDVKTFEKLLPFAIALGMGGIWSELFKDIYRQTGTQPTWYTGYNASTFNAIHLNDRLGNISKTASAAFTAKPSSASGGGSGFGGGGFSGGGFGGGGGGSW